MAIPNQPMIRNDVPSHPLRSKIVLWNVYYQITVEPVNEIKISIIVGQYGAFQIKVILQRECNAPATIMRVMNKILTPYLGKFVWVFLDDIIIFSNTNNDQLSHLW